MTKTTQAKATNTKPATGKQLANSVARSKQAQAAAKQAQASLAAAQAASPMPTAAAPVVAPVAAPAAPVVNLRGLPVALRLNPAKVYRTGAAHNAHWWSNVVAACAKGPASTAALLQGATGAAAMHGPTATTATGAPGHFLGYAVRRGYLVAA